MNKQDFMAVLDSARRSINKEWYESHSINRCTPYHTKHKEWVYKVFMGGSSYSIIIGREHGIYLPSLKDYYGSANDGLIDYVNTDFVKFVLNISLNQKGYCKTYDIDERYYNRKKPVYVHAKHYIQGQGTKDVFYELGPSGWQLIY